MVRASRDRADYTDFDVAVVWGKPEGSGDDKKWPAEFHRMDADDWEFPKPKSGQPLIIPVATIEGAFESYREHDGAPPCKKCFPAETSSAGIGKIGKRHGD